MSRLYDHVEMIRREVERNIRDALSGIFGSVKAFAYNTFMPLYVNIETDDEECCLIFRSGGAVGLNSSASGNPDVTIRISQFVLEDLLLTKSRGRFYQAEANGDIIIMAHTSKGQQAESKIREMFG